jgi:acetyl-CoA C-acetyltransferase
MLPLEIVEPKKDPVLLNIDEQYRANASLDALGRLKGIYGCKGITAGNAPGLNDGAAAILFMTRRKAEDLGLEPLAEIVAMCSIARAADRMGEAPAYAAARVLKQAELTLDEIAVLEINEAFAAVPLISLLKLADNDRGKAAKLHAKANVNGSAIAIGHPNTASGARIIMNLVYELRRRGGGFALGGICGGLAQADACIIKV